MVTVKFRHAAWAGPTIVDVAVVPAMNEVVSIEFDPGEPVRYLVSTVEHQIDDVDRFESARCPRRGRAGWIVVDLIDLDGGPHHGQPKDDG